MAECTNVGGQLPLDSDGYVHKCGRAADPKPFPCPYPDLPHRPHKVGTYVPFPIPNTVQLSTAANLMPFQLSFRLNMTVQ